jgi:crossover junction endodeoxyribonuclease RuvC
MARELPDLFEVERKVRRAAAAPAPLRVGLDPGARIIGLDLSLVSTGLASLHRGMLHHEAVQRPGKGIRRLQYIREDVAGFCAGAAMVLLEGVSFGSQGAMHAEICGLWYLVATALIDQGRVLIAVPPSTLKKFTCGAGNAKKEQMIHQVYKRWGAECATSDEADAVALVQMGSILGGLSTGTAEQIACAAKARRVL